MGAPDQDKNQMVLIVLEEMAHFVLLVLLQWLRGNISALASSLHQGLS